MYFKAEFDAAEFAPTLARIKRKLKILVVTVGITAVILISGLFLYSWASAHMDPVKAAILCTAATAIFLLIGLGEFFAGMRQAREEFEQRYVESLTESE